MNSRISELTKVIKEANSDYWINGDSKISDREYDRLVEELKSLDPDNELVQRVVDRPSARGGEFHYGDKPMLSLDKVYSLAGLIKWMRSVARTAEEKFLLQPKYDGLSGCIDGQSMTFATRGDGFNGEIINSKLPMIKICKLDNLQEAKFSHRQYAASGAQIRGEIVLSKPMFEKLRVAVKKRDGEAYKNPRNCVSGLFNPASSREDDEKLITQLSNNGIFVSFIDHDEISVEVSISNPNLEDVIKQTWGWYLMNIPFEQDGMVIKLADREYAESLGNTSHHSRGAIALKENDEGKPTRLRGINWTLGFDGSLSPTGMIDPVDFDVTVNNVLLHHFKNVVDMSMAIDGNTEINLEMAGHIIPFAAGSSRVAELNGPILANIGLSYRKASHDELADPDVYSFDWNGDTFVLLCPVCGSPLSYTEGDVDIYCVNKSCKGIILKRIYNSCSKCFKIDGIAESTLAKLYETRNLRNFYEIFDLQPSDLIGVDGFAQKSAEQLIDSIQGAANCTDVQVLASLGIPMIGMRVAADLLKEKPLEVLRGSFPYELMEIKGIGPEKAKSLTEGLRDYSDELDQLICRVTMKQTFSARGNAESKGIKTICFTGKAPYERSALQELAKRNGYEPVPSVTKTTSVLVCANGDSQSTKAQKARKYGVEVIEFDKWFAALECKDIDKCATPANAENPMVDAIFNNI
jgi:DNA ligase (NAD+)